MSEYNICTNYLEIISGTSNRASKVYQEAANNIAENGEKSIKYLQNFLTSIETMAASSKTKDPSITASAGNFKECKSYENIKYALDFLRKNLSNLPMLKDLEDIYHALELYQPQYVDGYRKKVRLVILEYENTVYMLIEGLATAMCTEIDYVTTGTKIKIKRKGGKTHEVINKIIADLAKELKNKNHKVYLENIIKLADEKPIHKVDDKPEEKPEEEKSEEKGSEEKKDEPKQEEPVKESVEAYVEGTVADVVDFAKVVFNTGKNILGFGTTALKAIKDSMFGIIPLIRSIMYIRYKRKADKIIALEDQVQFIQQNIEQLKNREGDMDPNKKAQIIKRQEAVIEANRKKAEKLRAQLMEEEKEAATALKQDNPSMSKTDDEFVLEGCTLMEIFGEENPESFF